MILFLLNLKSSDTSSQANTSSKSIHKFRSYLERNFDFRTLIAFNYMCECLKSVMLAVAVLERRIQSVDEACSLANLEQSFQFDKWGKVEWYHDINEQELMGRVSAGLLFVYLSSSSKFLIVNSSLNSQASKVL
jgi:ATP synthase F1 complex assembly factor 2